MTDNGPHRLLAAVPVRLIQTEGAIRIQRGSVDFRVTGDRAAQIVQRILRIASGRGVSPGDISAAFPARDRADVEHLVTELEKRRILVTAHNSTGEAHRNETPLDILYWHFGEDARSVNTRLSEQRMAILGINSISRQLVACLTASGVNGFTVVDDPLLRSRRFFDDSSRLVASAWELPVEPVPLDHWTPKESGCLVATIDYGGDTPLRKWNSFCLDYGHHFFPVVLQDFVGYVGPLVVPGESACLECLKSRWNSNLGDRESRWDAHDIEGQGIAGFHPAMPATAAALAAFELTKFYGIRLPGTAVGRMIEINLLTMAMATHRILKAPRCPACSTLNLRASTSLTRDWFEINEADRR